MSEIQENTTTCSAPCRICAKPSDNVFDLFSAEHNGKKFVEMLAFCLKQLIHENDGFPRTICNDCASNLIKVHAFHTVYYDSEQYFRRLISSTENKVKLEVESEPDEAGHSQIKVENDGHIVVHPDISFFDREEFDAQKSQDLDMNDSDNSEFFFKDESAHFSSKKSKKYAARAKSVLKSHRLHSERNKFEFFECFQCKRCFTRFSSLQRHANSHTKKVKPYDCTECQIKFVYLKSLFRHRRQKHPERVYECEYCTDAFESLSKLKKHVTGTHKNESKIYKCDLCSKTFMLSFQLACHQTEDICSQSFQCTSCDEAFPLHRMLKTHIRDKHTNHLCSECGKTFKTVHLLASHQNLHKSDTPFACSQCPNRFKWKAALTTHMLVHTGQKKHVCDICGSSFTTKGSLNKHHLIHTGTRPFPCETCSMRFYSKDHLKRHIRTHSGEKPYKCNYCDRAFSQSNDLTKHTRSHVGQNMYKCPECPKAFRLQTELRNHSYEHYEAAKVTQENSSTEGQRKSESTFS